LDQPVRDGFEGVGYLVELYLAIWAVAIVFLVLTIVRKLSLAGRVSAAGGSYVWASLLAYGASLLSALWFVPFSLTDDVIRTAALACGGMISAILSLIFALRARGGGRLPAIEGAVFLTLVWLPFFYGRFLLRTSDILRR
jgi:hypothetical protein